MADIFIHAENQDAVKRWGQQWRSAVQGRSCYSMAAGLGVNAVLSAYRDAAQKAASGTVIVCVGHGAVSVTNTAWNGQLDLAVPLDFRVIGPDVAPELGHPTVKVDYDLPKNPAHPETSQYALDQRAIEEYRQRYQCVEENTDLKTQERNRGQPYPGPGRFKPAPSTGRHPDQSSATPIPQCDDTTASIANQVAQRLDAWYVYREIGKAFKSNGVRLVVFLACKVGAAPTFLKKIAYDWQIPVRGYTKDVVADPQPDTRDDKTNTIIQQGRVRVYLEGDPAGTRNNSPRGETIVPDYDFVLAKPGDYKKLPQGQQSP